MYRTMLKPLTAALIATMPLSAMVAASAAHAGIKGSTSQINVDEKGVALGGYDPVAYFDSGKPTRGLDRLSARYGGARYLFVTSAHRRAFLANPPKYLPAFGGFCAVGTAFGEKVDVDPETGKVVNGTLYLNNSARALKIFDQDTAGIITKAQTNWPVVKDKAF
ncbi:YHS domain-containing (seleno)protein [Sphingomonas oligophenolica]|uniref:YHS domain-containing (Seleno)protein n=1 Tax=Sphingomonas oligophenolica TaxID=301154 RepID=A0ABU9Y210_9SPHN